MPVDTSARYYTWYMTADPTDRIVVFEWWPDDGEIVSSMTPGRMIWKSRKGPDDVWSPGRVIATLPWVVAQRMARDNGCIIEEAVK